ncbi:hypothetical protein D3C77_760570 [compost metagenome]
MLSIPDHEQEVSLIQHRTRRRLITIIFALQITVEFKQCQPTLLTRALQQCAKFSHRITIGQQ